MILAFFLSKNIRIARDRVYEQTIASRGKGPEFWKPYVEEWDNPPRPKRSKLTVFVSSTPGRMLIKSGCSLQFLQRQTLILRKWRLHLSTFCLRLVS